MLPVAFKCAGPLIQGADGFGVGAVVFVAAMAAHVNQTNASQYAKMLGHERLVKAEVFHDVANGALTLREIVPLPSTGVPPELLEIWYVPPTVTVPTSPV